jgi:hypothetical protein
MQPQATAFAAPSLPTWSVWQVPGAGVAVHLTAVGGTATVRVAPTASDTTAPTAAIVSAPTAAGVAPPSTSLTWAAGADAGSGVTAYTSRWTARAWPEWGRRR